jgi:hypothetical protein
MEAVWADMERTLLPTWISPAPRNWGTTTRGKLSADEWRVICTIHLPITLIRLWHHKLGRERELLDNFMDMVTAVRIANLRSSSANQAQAYDDHIFRYMEDLTRLFPDQSLKPVHHAALHIGHMLRLFGPLHSHSAPFYERYIKFLHGININQKPGLDLSIIVVIG